MRIKLVFNAQFCGKVEKIVESDHDLTKQEIEDLFEPTLGVKFDVNCYYNILIDDEFAPKMKNDAVLQNHYNEMVWTNADMESLRRQECLCFNCNIRGTCPTAKALYGICVRDGVAFLLTRCKDFKTI